MAAIGNAGTLTTLANSGTIGGTSATTGLSNLAGATISTVTNDGTIRGSAFGINNSGGTISTLVNNGVITGGTAGINNGGTIGTLVNSQGGANGPLTLSGALPREYVVKVNSPVSYGQLAYSGNDSRLASLAFAGDSALAPGFYSNLITGVSSIGGPIKGKIGDTRWKLKNGVNGTWDFLAWLYPDTVSTLTELGHGRDEILEALRNRAAITATALGNDCGNFDVGPLCLSVNARYTNSATAHEVAGVVTAAYRVAPGLRLGAFADYAFNRISQTARLRQRDSLPMFGGFVGLAPRDDGLGLQLRISAAYSSEGVTITRSDALETTEGGYGSSKLVSWAVGGEAAYGFAISKQIQIAPYLGLRYSDSSRQGYSEQPTGDVDFPITYAAFGQRLTTTRAGLQISGSINRFASYRFGGGIEYDLVASADGYDGASAIPDLRSFSIANVANARRFRAGGHGRTGLPNRACGKSNPGRFHPPRGSY